MGMIKSVTMKFDMKKIEVQATGHVYRGCGAQIQIHTRCLSSSA